MMVLGNYWLYRQYTNGFFSQASYTYPADKILLNNIELIFTIILLGMLYGDLIYRAVFRIKDWGMVVHHVYFAYACFWCYYYDDSLDMILISGYVVISCLFMNFVIGCFHTHIPIFHSWNFFVDASLTITTVWLKQLVPSWTFHKSLIDWACHKHWALSNWAVIWLYCYSSSLTDSSCSHTWVLAFCQITQHCSRLDGCTGHFKLVLSLVLHWTCTGSIRLLK